MGSLCWLALFLLFFYCNSIVDAREFTCGTIPENLIENSEKIIELDGTTMTKDFDFQGFISNKKPFVVRNFNVVRNQWNGFQRWQKTKNIVDDFSQTPLKRISIKKIPQKNNYFDNNNDDESQNNEKRKDIDGRFVFSQDGETLIEQQQSNHWMKILPKIPEMKASSFLENITLNWKKQKEWPNDEFEMLYWTQPISKSRASLISTHLFPNGQFIVDETIVQKKNGKNNAEEIPFVNVWIGSDGTIAPTHYDGEHNFYIQIRGKKHWTLHPPSQSHQMKLCPRWSPFYRQSMIDDRVDSSEIFKKNSAFSLTLNPADVLYLPPFWFHRVESEAMEDDEDGIVMAINFWSDSLELMAGSELYADFFLLPFLDNKDKFLPKVKLLLSQEYPGSRDSVTMQQLATFAWLNVLVSRFFHSAMGEPSIEHLDSFLNGLFESRYADLPTIVAPNECLLHKNQPSQRFLTEFRDLFQTELFQVDRWFSPISSDIDLIRIHLENYAEDLLFWHFKGGKNVIQFLSNCFKKNAASIL